MLTILPIMDSGPLLRAGQPKEEADNDDTQSCSASQTNASAWGDHHLTNVNKRRLANTVSHTPPLAADNAEKESFPLPKKIKTEPKDDYALAEEECARSAAGTISPFSLNPEYQAARGNNREAWELVRSTSPVFERIPSFAAHECHKFGGENCKRCIVNQIPDAELDNISLHRRRQIREFEQSGEEPLSNKIRVWKEKRLEKSLVRGKPTLRLDEEALFAELKNRQIDEETLHQMTTRSRHASSNTEEENGLESGEENNFGYLRYLLTRGNSSTSPGSAGEEEGSQGIIAVVTDNQELSPRNVVAVPARETFPECGSELVPRIETSAAGKHEKVTKKRGTKTNHVTSNVITHGGKSPSAILLTGNKSKGSKHKGSVGENGEETMSAFSNIPRGDYDDGVPNGSVHGDSAVETWSSASQGTSEQYISDIQRPYCNIPDDHQVTHINGVMSLPATRETRYGITLGELKRRTGYPEFLTRVDLIAYVRQSKSAGRALLDKYNIATAGQKSRPTIISKMCENEARVLGDGINRMNGEYFPWKTLARLASNSVIETTSNETQIEQKIKAIENTRTTLKEMYDLMVENKEIPSMKTFEIASHTFGTANILNHLTVFDRLFEEYQSNLVFRREVRNSNRKV